jgi:4-diphosphocytidyl-2C-methyl-D-erythritol kinase
VIDRPVKPFNDLAGPACRVQPPLADLQSRIRDLTQREVHITGSGAGMFVVAEDAREATGLSREISESMAIVAKGVTSLGRPA